MEYKRSCGPVSRHIDVVLESTRPVPSGTSDKKKESTRPVPRHSSQTNAGLSSENDDQFSISDDVYAITYDRLRDAVPARCDYTKTPPTIHKVPKELKMITYDRLRDAVPARCDYTKTPPTIYKVPKELKRCEEDEGYQPVAVNIGPFTGRNNSTAQLEDYKWCCVRQFMSRLDDHPYDEPDAGLVTLWLESMERLEPDIRASYSQNIEHSGDDLAVHMVLDGCFILHRLLKYARHAEREAAQEGIAKDDDWDWTQVFGRVWVWQLVEIDLLLLENQIPFFVLRKLFEDEPKDALVKGSLQLFRSLCPHMLQRSASEIDYQGVHHLLHLFYLSIAGPGQPLQPSEGDKIKHSSHQAADVLLLELPQWIPSAKELEEAGVKFKKRENAESFLDIKFHSGVLEIPPLHLYDFSDKLFRNLIAFEQTYPYTRCDITTYAVFMDCLINTPEDMRILHMRGILVNQINGEQDASRFFSRICAQVRWPADNNHLKNVMDKVNSYRGSRLPKWRAALVRNYFSNPWVAMSVLAAMLLLAMTILQTTFTVLPYFNPPK